MTSRKPDYVLKVLNKDNEGRCNVGAGWKNEDGSVSIQLNPCVVLQYDPQIVLTLFPKWDEDREKEIKKKEKVRTKKTEIKPYQDDDGDEIPF